VKYGIFSDSEMIVGFCSHVWLDDYGQIELRGVKHTLLYNEGMNKVFISLNENEPLLVLEKNDEPDGQEPEMLESWPQVVAKFAKYEEDKLSNENKRNLINSIFIN